MTNAELRKNPDAQRIGDHDNECTYMNVNPFVCMNKYDKQLMILRIRSTITKIYWDLDFSFTSYWFFCDLKILMYEYDNWHNKMVDTINANV